MTNQMKNLFFALGLGLLTLASCSKYEEGSKFTVLSKKSRIVNTWEGKTMKYGTTTETFNSGDYVMTVEKDGKYTSTFGSYTSTGTWDFNDDKTSIITTDATGDKDTMIIVKLKSKELTLKSTDTEPYILTFEEK